MSSTRKERSRVAREIINNIVPKMLRDKRAAAGTSRLIKDALVEFKDRSDERSNNPVIEVVEADTLTAARKYLPAKITVQSMCSENNPGGGVKEGCRTQEESLCLESTLLPGLKPEWYALRNKIILSTDVLVFQSHDLQKFEKNERFYVNVISCAALKGTNVSKDNKYENEQDRETMTKKIRGIIRTAVHSKTEVLVLGAFGCGAYGNPAEEVAMIYRNVIYGTKNRNGEYMGNIKKIVFAIKPFGNNGKRNVDIFKKVFE